MNMFSSTVFIGYYELITLQGMMEYILVRYYGEKNTLLGRKELDAMEF